MKTTLGQRLSLARRHFGVSQKEIVRRIGIIYGESAKPTQQAISKLESQGLDSSELVVKLATALGISPWWLDAELGPMILKNSDLSKFRPQTLPPDIQEQTE